MRLRFIFYTLGLWACAALIAVGTHAQDASTGAIRGAVVDVSARRIAGAPIALVNAATGFRYFCKTDSQGEFAFQLLPAGDYSARATSRGMDPQLTPILHVDIGAVTHVEFNLSITGVKETVTVSGEAPLVETMPSPGDAGSSRLKLWGQRRPRLRRHSRISV